MAENRTIAELAERKAELLAELDALNVEIKSRAGESDDDTEAPSYTTTSEPIATDTTAQTAAPST